MKKSKQKVKKTKRPDIPGLDEIDKEIARLKLKAMQVDIDVLSAQQVSYLASWEHGT